MPMRCRCKSRKKYQDENMPLETVFLSNAHVSGFMQIFEENFKVFTFFCFFGLIFTCFFSNFRFCFAFWILSRNFFLILFYTSWCFCCLFSLLDLFQLLCAVSILRFFSWLILASGKVFNFRKYYKTKDLFILHKIRLKN